MEKCNYIHWENYFTDTFLKEYENFKNFYQNNKNVNTETYNYFKNLYNCACTLLDYFLSNNGIFKHGNKNIIRTAFRYGLIFDGDSWIELNIYIDENNISDNLIADKLCLFESLVQTFNEMLVNNG